MTSENRLNLPGVYWTRFSSLYTDVSDVEDKKTQAFKYKT